MSWRARQRRKAVLRWLLSLLLFGSAAGLGLWATLGMVLESIVRRELEKSDISCSSLKVASWSPWFLELHHIHLARDSWTLKIRQLQVDLLPWKIVLGKVENLHLSGLELNLTATVPTNATSPQSVDLPLPLPLPDIPFRHLFLQDASVYWTQKEHTFHFSLQGQIDATHVPWQVTLQINGKPVSGQAAIQLAPNGEGRMIVALNLRDLPSLTSLWPAPQMPSLQSIECSSLALESYTTLQQLQPNRVAATLHAPNLLWRQNDHQIQTSNLAAALSWVASQPPQAQFLLALTQFTDTARGLEATAETTTLSFRDNTIRWDIPSLQICAQPWLAHLSLAGSIESWTNPRWKISAGIEEACWSGYRLQPFLLQADGDASSLTGNLNRLALQDGKWGEIVARDISFTSKNLSTTPEFEASALIDIFLGNHPSLELALWSAGFLPAEGKPKLQASLTNRKADFYWSKDELQLRGTGGCNVEVFWQDDLWQLRWDGTVNRMTLQVQDTTASLQELSWSGNTVAAKIPEWQTRAEKSLQDWTIWWEMLEESAVQGKVLSLQDLVLHDWEMVLRRDRPVRRSISGLIQSAQYKNISLSHLAADLVQWPSGWKISANGLFSTEEIPFAVEAVLQKEGRLDYQTVSQTHSFSQSSLLPQLLPSLGDLLVSGRFSAQSSGFLQDGNLVGSVLCLIEGASVCSRQSNLDVFGIDTQLEFHFDQGLFNPTEQCITFTGLSSEKLQLSQGLLCFQLMTPKRLKISRLEFEFLGAQWLAVPFEVDLETMDYTMAFAVVGMDLVELTDLLPDLQLRLAGLADGVLSIGFKNKQPIPLPGYLELRQGLTGKIKYLPKGWLTGTSNSADNQNLGYLLNASVESALDDFDVDKMRIEMQPHPEQPSDLRIQLVASGSGYGSGLKTRIPIGNFTVNFLLPWEEITNLSLLRLLSTGKLQWETGN